MNNNEIQKPLGLQYYDQGWNDAHKGLPYTIKATKDWQDGWKDYKQAPKEHQTIMK